MDIHSVPIFQVSLCVSPPMSSIYLSWKDKRTAREQGFPASSLLLQSLPHPSSPKYSWWWSEQWNLQSPPLTCISDRLLGYHTLYLLLCIHLCLCYFPFGSGHPSVHTLTSNLLNSLALCISKDRAVTSKWLSPDDSFSVIFFCTLKLC